MLVQNGLLTVGLWALLCCGWGFAQTIDVINPSFEDGTDAPAGWTLSGGDGKWTDGGCDGARAVAVTGTGKDSNYWLSQPLRVEPNATYRLRFHARAVSGGGGGTPITGPVFCNRDLGGIPEEWTEYSSIFVTPTQIDPETARLRFGQWQVAGAVAYDQVELLVAKPVHAWQGRIVLGEGERIAGNAYEFRAPYQGEPRNHSRPLVRHQCMFNTYRWVFTPDSEVVYAHEIGGRRQVSGAVEVNVGYYEGGELIVEAGTDGQNWQPLGNVHERAARTFALPAGLFPAEKVWVRLRARGDAKPADDFAPGAFQVDAYGYRATLDGAPMEITGSTRYVAVPVTDSRLKVNIETLGDCYPGGNNTLRARIENLTNHPIAARPTLRLGQGNETSIEAELKPGETVVEVPYTAPNAGVCTMEFSLGPGIAYRAERLLRVPDLYDASDGETLPGSTEQVGLWRASSGWKIGQTRPLPAKTGAAVTISAAANEAEAAQLVVRPSAPLRGFEARASELRGPNGATIPADRVDVLRVRYVSITQPTDAVGTMAPWPDPLPPFRGAIDLAANCNQPLWVRVTVPAGTPAGTYTGAIRLTAENYAQEVPLHVIVYGFALPDRMTCGSAFGFSPSRVFQYQKLTTPEQQHVVIDKYWANYSAHHISTYRPDALDPLKVTWPGTPWQGGQRDRTERHAGESSLLLDDHDAKMNVESRYATHIPIPKIGIKLRFAYKTREDHQPFNITLSHFDANDQWMYGRNNDIRIEGNGQWQVYENTVAQFPEGAKGLTIALRPTLWTEDGSTTGAAWFDEVSLQDAGTGEELIKGGDFDPLTEKNLTPTFDWAAWDAALARAFDVYHFTSISVPIPGLGGGTFYSREEPSLLGYGENTPEYKTAFTAYCRGLQEHLREKGWLDKAYVYWFDEPEPRDYAFVMNGFQKLKEAAPDIGRMLTEQVESELVGGPNIWCPLTPAFNAEAADARRAAGDRFWWYVCTGPKEPYCTLFIDHPATELRVWLWQTWQRHIVAVLVWESTYWSSDAAYPDPAKPQNPYEDPMGWTSGYGTAAGARLPWGNGDGRFVYPPEAAADAHPAEPVLDGPVDSIRWEMLRDGIEDYEYLTILNRMMNERGSQLSPEKRAAYNALLEVPAAITSSITAFTKDPAPIEERRNAVARAIEELMKLR